MTEPDPRRTDGLIDVLATAHTLLETLDCDARAELRLMKTIRGDNRHSRRIDRIAREALRLVRIANKANAALGPGKKRIF